MNITPWNQVEDNTKESFRLAKNDIINFGIELAKVQQAQRQIAEEVGTLKGAGHEATMPDFSGVYRRTDALQHQLDALKLQTCEHGNVEKELEQLKARYVQLVSMTKELVQLLEKKQKTKVIKIAEKKEFHASKASSKVHQKKCPFAKNIARKNKIVFKSRMTAFKKGYKACKCLQ